MTNFVMGSIQKVFSQKASQRLVPMLAGAGALLLQIGQPALAGDPFRTEDPHAISDTSEQLFYAMFRDGDYAAALDYRDNTDTSVENDPMFYAISAALHYLEGDFEGVRVNAELTQQKAQALSNSDDLRGNLYEAVGIFLEGAYILEDQGIARGTPAALSMLQQVFDRLDTAEAINPQDPELSLLKGFMDLLLAVNLPFANPEQAIEKLANYGEPEYVAHRGIAIGYRDLNRNADALAEIDKAIALTPNNPDLLYLKAQILVRLGGDGDTEDEIEYLQRAIASFDQALEDNTQLLPNMIQQIEKEKGRACRRLDENPCDDA